MDFQSAYNVFMALVVPMVLAVWKMGNERITAAEEKAASAAAKLAEYKLHVSETYLAIRRFEGFEERLFSELKAIKEQLGDKQDRV